MFSAPGCAACGAIEKAFREIAQDTEDSTNFAKVSAISSLLMGRWRRYIVVALLSALDIQSVKLIQLEKRPFCQESSHGASIARTVPSNFDASLLMTATALSEASCLLSSSAHRAL